MGVAPNILISSRWEVILAQPTASRAALWEASLFMRQGFPALVLVTAGHEYVPWNGAPRPSTGKWSRRWCKTQTLKRLYTHRKSSPLSENQRL